MRSFDNSRINARSLHAAQNRQEQIGLCYAREYLPTKSSTILITPRPVSIGYLRVYSLLCCFSWSQLCNSIICFGESLHIFQLFLIQPEIVTQFMNDRKADLLADLGLSEADGFDILLIKNNMIGS